MSLSDVGREEEEKERTDRTAINFKRDMTIEDSPSIIVIQAIRPTESEKKERKTETDNEKCNIFRTKTIKYKSKTNNTPRAC